MSRYGPSTLVVNSCKILTAEFEDQKSTCCFQGMQLLAGASELAQSSSARHRICSKERMMRDTASREESSRLAALSVLDEAWYGGAADTAPRSATPYAARLPNSGAGLRFRAAVHFSNSLPFALWLTSWRLILEGHNLALITEFASMLPRNSPTHTVQDGYIDTQSIWDICRATVYIQTLFDRNPTIGVSKSSIRGGAQVSSSPRYDGVGYTIVVYVQPSRAAMEDNVQGPCAIAPAVAPTTAESMEGDDTPLTEATELTEKSTTEERGPRIEQQDPMLELGIEPGSVAMDTAHAVEDKDETGEAARGALEAATVDPGPGKALLESPARVDVDVVSHTAAVSDVAPEQGVGDRSVPATAEEAEDALNAARHEGGLQSLLDQKPEVDAESEVGIPAGGVSEAGQVSTAATAEESAQAGPGTIAAVAGPVDVDAGSTAKAEAETAIGAAAEPEGSKAALADAASPSSPRTALVGGGDGAALRPPSSSTALGESTKLPLLESESFACAVRDLAAQVARAHVQLQAVLSAWDEDASGWVGKREFRQAMPMLLIQVRARAGGGGCALARNNFMRAWGGQDRFWRLRSRFSP
eukprot:6214424-Pleurochrysis_carterae.AAC.2